MLASELVFCISSFGFNAMGNLYENTFPFLFSWSPQIAAEFSGNRIPSNIQCEKRYRGPWLILFQRLSALGVHRRLRWHFGNPVEYIESKK